MNSRFTQAHSRKDAIPDDTLADRTKTIAKTDKIVLDLLSSGLSGGKVERARQILQKVDQCSVVSIDGNSGRLMLHDRDLGLTVFDFLNDLQTTTIKLEQRNARSSETVETAKLFTRKHTCKARSNKWRRMTAMTKRKLEVVLQRSGCDYTERIRYLLSIHLPQGILS